MKVKLFNHWWNSVRNPNQDVDGASASTSAQVDYGEQRRLRPNQPGCSSAQADFQYQSELQQQQQQQPHQQQQMQQQQQQQQQPNLYRDVPVDRLEARIEDYDDDDELDSSDPNKVS